MTPSPHGETMPYTTTRQPAQVRTGIRNGLVAAAVLVLAACQVSDPTTADVAQPGAGLATAKLVPAVSYGMASAQRADIYLPATRKWARTPVIVFVHGGTWSGGDRVNDLKSFAPSVTAMLDRGWAVMSIDYRLVPTVLVDKQVSDVRQAVKWIRSKAAAYALDPTSVIVAGHSAGGHLALLAALSGTQFDAGTAPELSTQSGRPDGVIALAPVTDMAKLVGVSTIGTEGVAAALGCPKTTPLCNSALLTKVSPLNYVDANDPPVYLAHGSGDTMVPFKSMSQTAYGVLAPVMGSSRVWFDVVEGVNHDLPGVNASQVALFCEKVRTHTL